MSKEKIVSIFNKMDSNDYNWTIYFFAVNKRKDNPYIIHKVRFKNKSNINNYLEALIKSINKFQINQINCVQEYDSLNTKVSCDKLNLDSNMIKNRWRLFSDAVKNAGEQKINGKIVGYVIDGQVKENNKSGKNITFIKIANPILKLKDKKKVAYYKNELDELDELTSDMYRFYLTIDLFVVDDNMYTFNHAFEKMFDIDSTLTNIKLKASNEICSIDAYNNIEFLKSYLKSYKSARTFVTLNTDRLDNIKTSEGRKKVSEMLNIPLENNKFTFTDEDQTKILTRYLCYKLFKDYETEEVYEANSVVKVEV